MQIIAELHCHTRFSDGVADPLACVKAAARKGINVLAITDHNTAEGALPFWELPIQHNVIVIPGEEISTDQGHLLAYFVRESILPGSFDLVLKKVRQQGALAFMAHPFHIPVGNQWRRRSILKLSSDQLPRLDGIEVENGHNRTKANKLSKELAEKERVRMISGSDAHYTWEIGNARTLLDLQDFSLEAVRDCLLNGIINSLPRRWNALPVYYWVGLTNRLMGKHYSWKEKR